MKTSDHEVESLKQALNDEAAKMRERADKLDSLAKTMVSQIRLNQSTPHTFEFVAQEAIDVITHRSSVMPQTIARQSAACAAIAAVEWAEKQRTA